MYAHTYKYAYTQTHTHTYAHTHTHAQYKLNINYIAHSHIPSTYSSSRFSLSNVQYLPWYVCWSFLSSVHILYKLVKGLSSVPPYFSNL